TINLSADLVVGGTGPTKPVPAGGVAVYLFTVTNAGPSPASSVTFTDALPAGATATDAIPDQGVCNLLGQTVSCSLGIIPSGVAIVVEVHASPTVIGQAISNAGATAAEPDPNPANSSVAISTDVTAGADLALTQR